MVIPKPSVSKCWPRNACTTAMLAFALMNLAFSVCADPLSFDNALALAVREMPALRAEATQVDAARQAPAAR
jgi:hypothetical protein